MAWLESLISSLRKGVLRYERLITIVLGAAALSSILVSFEFDRFEAITYDLRVRQGWQSIPDPAIELITLDDTTTRSLNDFAPLPLDLHAQFLERLERLNPRAVGYLVDLNQVAQAAPELLRSPWATRFVESAMRLQARGTPFLFGTPFDVTGEVIPPYPLSSLPHSVAVIHKDGNVFAEDKITRRALVSLYDRPVFHLELIQRLGLAPSSYRPTGTFEVPEAEAQYFFFRYHGNTTLYPKGGERPAYRRISFLDVLNDRLPADYFKDRIVLVGTLSKEDSRDFAFTPYSMNPLTHPKIVAHANILDAVLHNDGIKRAPSWLNPILTFGVCVFVLSWVLLSTPLKGLVATLVLGFLFHAVSQVLFSFQGWWIRESQPLFGLFIAYYLAVPYRLIREYRKRWEYQRKNELLTQVEELKTNFLSLVTHDLKTPVARIQGLSEVLRSKLQGKINDKEMENLRSIFNSTEELNHFISSVLELNKVESHQLQIRKESKDLNQLIERSIEGLATLARVKNIRLEADLEPLFPIRIDTSLVSKVINNLVDNAIKYSPQGSRVLIQSREVAPWLVVSVVDQGIGMTLEERENLFTRFYRAKNDTTTRVAGTGLGLYLTKYFVEAHDGRVEVESAPGEGSTFRIYLPIEGTGVAPSSESAPGLRFGFVERWLSSSRTKGEK